MLTRAGVASAQCLFELEAMTEHSVPSEATLCMVEALEATVGALRLIFMAVIAARARGPVRT